MKSDTPPPVSKETRVWRADTFPDWASNFYPARIVIPNLRRFPIWLRGYTVENVEVGYQMAKFLDDPGVWPESPGKAKRLGRSAALSDDWEDRKIWVMWALLVRKFNDPRLLRVLQRRQAAGAIVEWNNWHDQFWGADVSSQKGANVLGQLLMSI